GQEHGKPEGQREPQCRLAPQKTQEAACAGRRAGRHAGMRCVLDEPIAQSFDPLTDRALGDAAAPFDRLGRETDSDLVDAVELLEAALDRLRAARAVHSADLVAEPYGVVGLSE